MNWDRINAPQNSGNQGRDLSHAQGLEPLCAPEGAQSRRNVRQGRASSRNVMLSCQSEDCRVLLRKYTAQEDGPLIFCRPPWTNEEHNVFSALELRLELLEAGGIRNRLLIKFEDNVSALQLNAVAEAIRLDVGYLHSPSW